jgi:hypothetical protein
VVRRRRLARARCPIDEAVPMLFEMGRTASRLPARHHDERRSATVLARRRSASRRGSRSAASRWRTRLPASSMRHGRSRRRQRPCGECSDESCVPDRHAPPRCGITVA